MKIATLICGDYRSCPKVIEHIFKYVETLGTVDYYFATWSTTRDHWWPPEVSAATQRTVTNSDITDLFIGRSLIDYKLVDQSQLPAFSSTFYYQGYLAKIANILKRKHELAQDFVYDQVVESRPDLYPLGTVTVNCQEFELANGPVWVSNGIPQMFDHLYHADSFVNDVVGNRYSFDKYLNRHNDRAEFGHTHWILYDYVTLRKLLIKEITGTYIHYIPVRPNFPNNYSELSVEELKALDNQWIQYQWSI